MEKIGLLVLGVVFFVSLVSAVPGSPHGFFGEVKYSGGASVESGVVVAKIGGVEVGRSSIVEGGYDLVATSGIGGVRVYFYLEGSDDVIGDFDFVAFEVSEYDLEVADVVVDSGDDGSGDGGSSGSSGSSGSGSSSGSSVDSSGTIVLNSVDDSEEDDLQLVSSDDVDVSVGGGMTGGVVGILGTTGGLVVVVFIVLVVGMLVGVLVRRK